MNRLNVVFLLAFVGILVWITMFHSSDFVERVQRGAMSFFAPFISSSAKLSTVAEGVEEDELTPSEMKAKLAALKRERDGLRLEVLQLDEVIDENNELRKALQYKERVPLELLAARVVSRKPSNWYNTIVISKGADDGVEPDSPVIVSMGEEAALVGKVSEVRGKHTAVVLLLTDEMCQVSAKLENTQEEGIVTGQRGTLRERPNLRLRYLSKEVLAKTGQRVISSGAGELFPPNLILGEVASVKVGVLDAEATLKTVVDFDKLKDVFVLILDQEKEKKGGEAPASGGEGKEDRISDQDGNGDPVALPKPATAGGGGAPRR